MLIDFTTACVHRKIIQNQVLSMLTSCYAIWTCMSITIFFFFFKDPAPPDIYPFPQPNALPIWAFRQARVSRMGGGGGCRVGSGHRRGDPAARRGDGDLQGNRRWRDGRRRGRAGGGRSAA